MQTTVKDDKKSITPPPVPTNGAAEEAESTRIPREVFVVGVPSGKIDKFKNLLEAEKFLNNDPMAPKTFRIFKGIEIVSKQKVSLR